MSLSLNNKYITFYLISIGELISNVGDRFHKIALPILVYQLTGSLKALSLVVVLELLPQIIMSFFTGQLLTSYKIKTVMMVSIFIQILLCLMIPIIVFVELPIIFIYAIAFLLPSFQIVFQTSINVLMPLLFEKSQLKKYNAQFQGFRTVSKLVSPAIAGFLIIYLSINILFFLNAASFLILLLILCFLRFPNNLDEGEIKDENLKDIWFGFKYVYQNEVLRSIIVLMILINIAMVGFNSALVFYLKDHLSLTDDLVGLVYSFAGFGSLLASIFLSTNKNISIGKLTIYSVLAIPFFILVSPLYAHWIYFGSMYALISFAITVASIGLTTICQQQTEQKYLGKVFSSMYVITLSLSPIGALLITGINNIIAGIIGLALTIVTLTIVSIFKFKNVLATYSEGES